MNLIKGLRRYGQIIQHDPKLDREFLVRLWIDDRKLISSMEKRQSKSYDKTKRVLKQPPLSQPTTGALKPSFPEEVSWVAYLFSEFNLNLFTLETSY